MTRAEANNLIGVCTCMCIDSRHAEMCRTCYETASEATGVSFPVVDLGVDPWGGSVQMSYANYGLLMSALDD